MMLTKSEIKVGARKVRNFSLLAVAAIFLGLIGAIWLLVALIHFFWRHS
jgi:predicted RND superfamily exporter protein